jgi:hypothetical protein
VNVRRQRDALLAWIDTELGPDVPEVSVPLRRIVARSAQLEVVAHRAREVLAMRKEPLADRLLILDLALTELDNHPLTRDT